ncbi:MAG: exopolysaccharide biosynthesis polyprenyl glycosylphosphotransferase [Candidatus Nanopelagicales bacterium]
MKSIPQTSLAKSASRYSGIAFILDTSIVIASALIATFLRSRFDDSFIDDPRLLAIRLTGYSIIWIGGLYLRSTWARSNFMPNKDSLNTIASASWRVAILIFALLYLIKMPISRIWVGTMLITTAVFLIITRIVYQEILNKRYSNSQIRKVLVISSREDFDEAKEEFEKSFESHSFEYFRVPPPSKSKSKDWLEKMKSIIDNKNIDAILIGFGAITETTHFLGISDDTRARVLDVYMISRIAPIVSRLDRNESTNLLIIKEPKILDSGRLIKRLIDLSFGFILFILSFPILLFAALGVKLTSKGPILYTDKRVGQSGNLFLFPKFRTMYKGSSDIRLQVLGRPDFQMPDRYKNDPRITPFGRFLRRWSIDELPQLWCVIIGTMSLVGPRPILFQEIPQVLKTHQARFIAKPGLTGLWQVSGRKLTSWEERMSGDIAYIQDWSLSNDFALLFRTIGILITGKGSL